MEPSELAKLAEMARKARGWTQRQAADATGLSLRRYGDIERGQAENITSDTIQAIMRNLVPTEGGAELLMGPAAYDDSGLRVVDRRVSYQLVDTLTRKVTLRVTMTVEIGEGRTQEMNAGGLT